MQGNPTDDQFSCEASIGREPDRAGSRVVDADGDHALTHFEVVERRGEQTLLLCRPQTGRTNQIRIHLSHLDLPIVGDPIYGPAESQQETQTKSLDAEPMCLHAWKLLIDHPDDGQRMNFAAPKPAWA